MARNPIRTVAVIGCGLIGASWTALFLARGLRVLASDPAPGAQERLHAWVAQYWRALSPEGGEAWREHLVFEPDAARAAAQADFVQENGPERLALKQALFAVLDEAAGPEVIVATSSSGLSVSQIQQACGRPQRVVLGHPFNPPHLIPLVEVGGGETTAPDTIDAAMDFYRSIGKHPIRLRAEVPGHVANRLQAALWREAISLVEQGVASVEDVDAAVMHGPGLRWALFGPFLNLHLGGGDGGIAHMLEHLGPPMESWWKTLGEPVLTPELKARIAAGVEQAARGRGVAELAAERDEMLGRLLALKTRVRG